MASVIMVDLARRHDIPLEVRSAGTAAVDGMPMAPDAAQALSNRGLDAGNHQARSVTVEDLQWADVVLAMTRHHKQRLLEMYPEQAGKIFALSEYSGIEGDIEDPIGLGLEAYEACARDLEQHLRKILDRWQEAGQR